MLSESKHNFSSCSILLCYWHQVIGVKYMRLILCMYVSYVLIINNLIVSFHELRSLV